MRCLAVIVASLTAVSAVCEAAQEKSASSMRDVQSHFAACFQPPQDAKGSQITFYFSLTRDGQVYGRPRIVWFGFKGSPENRKLLAADFLNAFKRCLPVPLSEGMARTIPGKVYFLQFDVAAQGSKSTRVALRPYGSHGPYASGAIVIHRHGWAP